MLFPCRYYTANTRLFAGMGVFSQEPGFWFCTLQGIVVVNKGSFKATTQYVTVMVCCISSDTKKPITAILTTNPEYVQFSGKQIDTDIIPTSNIYMTLCSFLKDKFGNTRNPFELTLMCEGSTAVITAEMFEDKPRLKATIKIPTGEAIVTGDHTINAQLRGALSIRSFGYQTISPSVEKEVIVKKCYGEILREVAHYLNRTLVLVCSSEKHQIVKQYISAISAAEVFSKEDGTQFYKKMSASAIETLPALCIYMTTSSVDDILREQSRVLKK